MTTYDVKCRCGERSPKFGSRESAHAWHARHVREDCVARRSAPTTRARPADPELPDLLAQARKATPARDELDALLERARRLEPIAEVEPEEPAQSRPMFSYARVGPYGTIAFGPALNVSFGNARFAPHNSLGTPKK
jgi:hypothetical protein